MNTTSPRSANHTATHGLDRDPELACRIVNARSQAAESVRRYRELRRRGLLVDETFFQALERETGS